MTSPKRSVVFWDVPYGTSTLISVGDVVIPTTTNDGWLVSTTANRGSRRSEGIALTAFGGTGTGTIEIQQVGTLDASYFPELGAGSESWVRTTSTGRLERFSPSVGGTSDVVGRVFASGRVALMFGITETVAAGGGGSTFGGANGDVVIQASATTSTGVTGNNGDTLYKTGGVWTSTPAVQTPTGTGVVTVTGGVIDPAATAPGTSGNVLTSNGTAWTSAAPTSGAPVGASYVVIANDGTLTADRKLTAGTGISLTDGGANGNITIAATGGSFTAPTGTGFVTVTSGALDAASLAFPLAVNKGGTALTAPPGNSTEVLVNSGGTGYGAATNVKAGSSFISIGSGTVNTVGLLRFAYSGGAQSVIIGLKDNGGTDRVGFAVGAGNIVQVGHNESNLNLYGNDVLLSGNSTTQINANSQFMFHGNGTNIGIFASATNVPASVTGVCYLKNASAAPTTLTSNPSGGGLLYSEAGAGKWQGTSGTRTTFGPADPHCKKCGRDFAHEWENVINNERLMVCVPCMLDALSAIGIAVDEFAERRLKP